MADDYESVLCVKNEVLIYKIPPRTTNRGYRAADWKLDQPDWTGRLRVCAKAKECYLKIEDRTSGELFAKCPVDNYPGIAVEGVLDSSRYFVLRIQDESGRHAFIGMGFQDRGDAFDFNVALQDHFKWIKQSERLEAETSQPELVPKLDLGFKEGQTITINLGNKKPGASKPRPAVGGMGILPPPPGGLAPRLAPPPSGAGVSPLATRKASPMAQSQAPTQMPLFSDFAAPPAAHTQQQQQRTGDEWGDFTSASGSSDSSWVQF